MKREKRALVSLVGLEEKEEEEEEEEEEEAETIKADLYWTEEEEEEGVGLAKREGGKEERKHSAFPAFF